MSTPHVSAVLLAQLSLYTYNANTGAILTSSGDAWLGISDQGGALSWALGFHVPGAGGRTLTAAAFVELSTATAERDGNGVETWRYLRASDGAVRVLNDTGTAAEPGPPPQGG